MDVLVLTTPKVDASQAVPVTTGYRLSRLRLDWTVPAVVVTLTDNNGQVTEYAYQDAAAQAVLDALSAPSSGSLQAAVLGVLMGDGHLPNGLIQDQALAAASVQPSAPLAGTTVPVPSPPVMVSV